LPRVARWRSISTRIDFDHNCGQASSINEDRTKGLFMAADIRSLTGVRGVAAVIIVVYHFGKFRLDPSSSVTVWSVPHGYLPVDMFFMLS
jgi:hypothetical protein